jgi:hypothetical protein
MKLQSGDPFDVPQIPGSQGFALQEELDGEPFQFHTVVFRESGTVFQVLIGGPPGSTSADVARDIAQRQWAKP